MTQLVGQNGEPLSRGDLEGRWTFLAFGYTHCPDVCPTSLTMLGQVQRKLEKRADLDQLPQMLFVSVDPERDTPELMGRYVDYFGAVRVGDQQRVSLNAIYDEMARTLATLIEAAQRFGGHTNTVDVEAFGQRYSVDTGFMVFNERTYPNFCRMLRLLHVEACGESFTLAV